MTRPWVRTFAAAAIWTLASVLMAQQSPQPGFPNAASMCYDGGANQLVIPMNANNALAFVPLK
jgi:hypothetical protein